MDKTRIGIIGCDSFHTPVLVKMFNKLDGVEVVFVDTTLRSNLEQSGARQKRFKAMIEDQSLLVNIDLDIHTPPDLYCVLNMDASMHLSIIKSLEPYGKPIFVDKPIFNDLSFFEEVKGMNLMSSSGLRFCDFLKDVKLDENIVVEGPLSFMEGIQGYYWYGIHMVEMLHMLTKASIEIESVTVYEDREEVKGRSGPYTFSLIGYYDESINFSVNSKYQLSSYDDLYESLAKAILSFKENMKDAKVVIQAVEDINRLRG